MGDSSFMSAPTILEYLDAIFIISIVSSQNKPPGSGVPVAGIKQIKTINIKGNVNIFIFYQFLKRFKFHFFLSFAQKIFILFLFFF